MSEPLLQLCRFCQRNVKLAYYCEECGISCCSDCLHEEKIDYFMCQDCNSKNIEISDSGKRKVCKECGKENITQVNQLLKSCPKCHSHLVINIYEKKEDLEKKFLELIKNARTFIDPFRELVNTLYALRQQVENARSPPVKCYHYPNMESELLSLFKLFIYAKDNLKEKISILFHHLSLNKEYFFDIYTQPNSNIRIIEGILENLHRSFDSINDFIASNVKTINGSMETIQKNLLFIDKINFYFESYKKFLSLADNEKPVYAVYAKLANGLNTQDKYKKNRGILFITNFDLSFVHKFGKIKKKQNVIFKAPVKDLTRVKVKGKLFKKLYIEFPYGRYDFTLPQNVILKVMDYILLARNFDETVIYDGATAQKLYHLEIDLTSITNFIEEAINSFFSLKCQINNIQNQNSTIQDPNRNPNLLHQNNTYPGNQDLFRQHPNLPPNTYNIYNKNPNSPSLYHGNYLPPNGRNYQIQTPRDLNYYGNNLGQYLPPNINENEFFLQNFYNPNRIQNYQSDLEEKNFLMRRLEQLQKNSQPHSYGGNKGVSDLLDELSPKSDFNYRNQFSSYPESSRRHLSDFFNSDYSLSSEYQTRRRISREDSIKHKEMLELEQERYSLEETLKTLDNKFEKGIISEIDYFKTFKNLQKDIYLIDKKIEKVDERLREHASLRRTNNEFDRRRYYT